MRNCVYRFLNKENEIIYIGKATDLKNRMNGHSHLPKECYEERVRVEYTTLNTMDEVDMAERYFISKIKPKYNTTYKSKEIFIAIESFETLKWVELNKKCEEDYLNFEDRKRILKLEMNIKELSCNLNKIRNHMDAIQYLQDNILKSIGKGKPIVIHGRGNKRFHVFKEEMCDKTVKNSSGLDTYADLYEQWFDEKNKEEEYRKNIDKLKNEKISLLLKLSNRECDEKIKRIYVEFDSIDDNEIIDKILNKKEDKYKNDVCQQILENGYYDFNSLISFIDCEFIYSEYANDKQWLRLIEKNGDYEVLKEYADNMIKNVEKYVEGIFGNFYMDTIIKESPSVFNPSRVIPTAHVIKRIA